MSLGSEGGKREEEGRKERKKEGKREEEGKRKKQDDTVQCIKERQNSLVGVARCDDYLIRVKGTDNCFYKKREKCLYKFKR